MSAVSVRRLSLRRRIELLVWARRAWWLVILAALWAAFGVAGPLVVFLVLAGWIGSAALKAWAQSLRRQFLREAELPAFLGPKLCAAYPGLRPRDADLVLHGLRQFFIAHSRSGHRFVAMPSKVVDTAWHEFILHTRGYQRWCQTAFGRMLHHSPAEVLGKDARRNDGLRRSWYWACMEESIDPRKPLRLPLLLALDAKFDVPGGFRYQPDCSDIDRAAGTGAHCGSDFGSGGCAGDADGFGGSDSSSPGDGDSGSGCGGD
ncbi:MAG TPA: hypothetical protein VLJ19_12610 [Variovorax sp.]|nr:hypothetical protein [Variovorax sp.]